MQTDDNIFMKQKDVQAADAPPVVSPQEIAKAPAQPVANDFSDIEAANQPIVPKNDFLDIEAANSQFYNKEEVPQQVSGMIPSSFDMGGYPKAGTEQFKGSETRKSVLPPAAVADIGWQNDFINAKNLLEKKYGFEKAQYYPDIGIIVKKHGDDSWYKAHIDVLENGKLNFKYLGNELDIASKSDLFMGELISNAGAIAGGTVAGVAGAVGLAALGVTPVGWVAGGLVAGGLAVSRIAGSTAGQKIQDFISKPASRRNTLADEVIDQAWAEGLGMGLSKVGHVAMSSVREAVVGIGNFVMRTGGEEIARMKYSPVTYREKFGAAPSEKGAPGFMEAYEDGLKGLKKLKEKTDEIKFKTDKFIENSVADEVSQRGELAAKVEMLNQDIKQSTVEQQYDINLLNQERNVLNSELGLKKAAKQQALSNFEESEPGFFVDTSKREKGAMKLQAQAEEVITLQRKEAGDKFARDKRDALASSPELSEQFDPKAPASGITFSSNTAQFTHGQRTFIDAITDVGKDAGFEGNQGIGSQFIKLETPESRVYGFLKKYFSLSPDDRGKFIAVDNKLNALADGISEGGFGAGAKESISTDKEGFLKKVISLNINAIDAQAKATMRNEEFDREAFFAGKGRHGIDLNWDANLLYDASENLHTDKEFRELYRQKGDYLGLLDVNKVVRQKLDDIIPTNAKPTSKQAALMKINQNIMDTLATKSEHIKSVNVAYAQTMDAIRAAEEQILNKSHIEFTEKLNTKKGALAVNEAFTSMRKNAEEYGHSSTLSDLDALQKDTQNHFSVINKIDEQKALNEQKIDYDLKLEKEKIAQNYENEKIKIYAKYDITGKKLSLLDMKTTLRQMDKEIKAKQDVMIEQAQELEQRRASYIEKNKLLMANRESRIRAGLQNMEKAAEKANSPASGSIARGAMLQNTGLAGLNMVAGAVPNDTEKGLIKNLIAFHYRQKGLAQVLELPYAKASSLTDNAILIKESAFVQPERGGIRIRTMLDKGERPTGITTDFVGNPVESPKFKSSVGGIQMTKNVIEAIKHLKENLPKQLEVMKKIKNSMETAELTAGREASKLGLEDLKFAIHDAEKTIADAFGGAGSEDLENIYKSAWAKQVIKQGTVKVAKISAVYQASRALARHALDSQRVLGNDKQVVGSNTEFDERISTKKRQVIENFLMESVTMANKINQERMQKAQQTGSVPRVINSAQFTAELNRIAGEK